MNNNLIYYEHHQVWIITSDLFHRHSIIVLMWLNGEIKSEIEVDEAKLTHGPWQKVGRIKLMLKKCPV